MKTKELLIEVLTHGAMYAENGAKLRFENNQFILNRSGTPEIDEPLTLFDILMDSKWSKDEPTKQFDVIWIERREMLMQRVSGGGNMYYYGVSSSICTDKDDNDIITKCKPEEIRPNVAEFRLRCIEKFGKKEILPTINGNEIGDIFDYEGVRLEGVRLEVMIGTGNISDDCTECFFTLGDCIQDKCCSENREDNTAVYFKKLQDD